MEWVEVRGKSVDIAVEAALQELGISDRSRVAVEIVQEPEKGFLGLGGKDAIVRVKPRTDRKKRRRRKKKSDGGQERPQNRDRQQKKSGGSRPSERRERREQGDRGRASQEGPKVSIEEQIPVVKEFLEGLLSSFGLEGEVEVSKDDETIIADIRGPQTEAMVGPKGAVIEAIHELTKTVLQRKTQASARLRLDIAGYAERRRQALSIYANQLIDQVLEEGGEITLEPMSAADRKVIHDAAADRGGVRTYSEGEAPQRYVVIARTRSDDEEE